LTGDLSKALAAAHAGLDRQENASNGTKRPHQ